MHLAKFAMGYVRIVLLGGHHRTPHFALTPHWHADSIYKLQRNSLKAKVTFEYARRTECNDVQLMDWRLLL
jgi:hypothetical protein